MAPVDEEERALVLAPTGRDGPLTAALLARAGIQSHVCPDREQFLVELRRGAGVALLALEALHPALLAELVAELEAQPPWSDLPFVVFTSAQEDPQAVLGPLDALANVVVLERPMRQRQLTSVVRTALRSRRRQFQARALLRRLAEQDQRKDEFIALLGHELRNPLAAISTAASLLQSHPDRPNRPRLVEIIARQTGSLRRMLEDLLDVSRALSGKVVLRPEALDLNVVAERAQSDVAGALAAGGHRLSYEPCPGGLRVMGDPVRLEQVLVNLLLNAVKYTSSGGTIDLSLRREVDAAVVRVRDDGVGIPLERQAVIFEPFGQVETTLDRSQGGLGLGLPLVRCLVELHGGEVWVESRGAGCGALFGVRLPLLPASSADEVAAAPDDAPARPAAARRLLLVDDNRDLLDTLGDLLAEWGHEVTLASDGLEAVARAREVRPDVALVDIGLPGIDGYEVARRLRTHLGDGVRLVALSGYGHAQARARAAEAGFDAHLVKPVDTSELAAAIDAINSRDAPSV